MMLTPHDKRVIIATLLVAYVLFSSSILEVKAQTISISNLGYPSPVVLQNGIAQAAVTFTLSYSVLPPGDAILVGLRFNNPPGNVDGSGSSTSDPCLSSWDGSSYPGKASCFLAPSSSSGTESVTLTMKSAASPQQYSLNVNAEMVDSLGNGIGVSSQQTFTINVITAATDWAVLSVSMSPSNPQVGDLVTFSMVVAALSSPAPFPQDLTAICQIDGVSCGGGTITYPGPMGAQFTVSTQSPWTATTGTHTLAWGVATIPVGLDPNKGNNEMSVIFTVGPQVSISTATPEYQNFALPVVASLALVIIMLAKKAARVPRQRVV